MVPYTECFADEVPVVAGRDDDVSCCLLSGRGAGRLSESEGRLQCHHQPHRVGPHRVGPHRVGPHRVATPCSHTV